MKKITAMKNANIEVREQEKAVRSAMKAAAEADKEKQKNADNDNKRANAASNARKREQEEIRAAQEEEIKTMTNKISVLNAEYKNGYDVEKRQPLSQLPTLQPSLSDCAKARSLVFAAFG